MAYSDHIVRVRISVSGYPLFYGDILCADMPNNDIHDVISFARRWYKAVYKSINHLLRHTCVTKGYPLIQLQPRIHAFTIEKQGNVVTIHTVLSSSSVSRKILDVFANQLRLVKQELEEYLDEDNQTTEET